MIGCHPAVLHLTTMCALILLGAIVTTFFAPQSVAHGLHHRHWNCKPPYSTLYVYTEPVQKICTILEHNGKVVQALDQDQNRSTG